MDKTEKELAKILKSKHWPHAEKMIAALDKAKRPLPSEYLRQVSGCEKRKTHSVIYVVRRYYERIENTTLNRTDLGYHVGVNVGDHIDQATDHFAAIIARVKRHKDSMDIIGSPDSSRMSDDDRVAWMMNRAGSHLFDAIQKVWNDNSSVVMHSPKNQKRLEDAASKARHPFDPLDALQATRSDDDDDDDDDKS